MFADADTDGLVFVAERALDTGDTQDRVFIDDSADGAVPTRILTAWGDEDTITYHGGNFAKGQVFLYGGAENSDYDPIAKVSSQAGISFFDVMAGNISIPAVRTTYEFTCFPASALPAFDQYHAVGFGAVFNNETLKHVHHLILQGFTMDHCGEECFNDDSSSTTPLCQSLNFADIFLWAPGASDFALPDDVGFLLGNDSGRFVSLALQIHYNNPEEIEGLIDDSGVRVYYTEELRPINMGVLQLGDPFINLNGEVLPEGKSSHSFQCPSSCFEGYFEDDTVTVFSHSLHMHENGQRLETRQYRNNSDGEEVLVYSAEIEYYSFLQAGAHLVNANSSVTIQKGDRFETSCYYDTALSSVDSDNVTFGFGSENEMCIDFIWYYPDQDVPYSGACGLDVCGGTMDGSEALAADSDFERTFGVVDTCSNNGGGDEESFEDESNSSSINAIPGLVAFTWAVTSAIALATAPLIVNLSY